METSGGEVQVSDVARGGGFMLVMDSIKPPVWSLRFGAKFVVIWFGCGAAVLGFAALTLRPFGLALRAHPPN